RREARAIVLSGVIAGRHPWSGSLAMLPRQRRAVIQATEKLMSSRHKAARRNHQREAGIMRKTLQGIIGATALIFAFAIQTRGQNALQFTAARVTDEGSIYLEWASQSNHVYQIQCADALIYTDTGTTTWQVLYDEYPSQGSNTFWTDHGNYFYVPPILDPKFMPMRFYQVVDTGPDTTSDEPTVSITSPTNGSTASGE